MSSFLYALGRWCFVHAKRVLVAWMAVLVVCAGAAALLIDSFDNSFDLPGTESQQALAQLSMTFPEMAGTSASMIVVTGGGQDLDDPQVEEAIEASVERIGELDFVDSAQSPYFEMIDGLVSSDRRAGLANIMLHGEIADFSDDEKEQLYAEAAALEEQLPGSTVRMGGEAFATEIPGLSIIELIGVGVALVVLFFTMGSLIAAMMPLVNALIGVGISMTLILAATGLMTINSTTPMLALMLGLAVGIDYALFILSRYREHLAEEMGTEESAARAVATSGSAVVFAGMTVFIALVGLAVARIPFLTVMGIAAAGAIAVAVAISLTLMPALAGLAGERMRPRRVRRAMAERARTGQDPAEGPTGGASAADQGNERAAGHGNERMARVAAGSGGGAPGWWVRVITARPVVTIVLVVLALGALALPARDMQLALPNAGMNSEDSSSRQAYDLTEEYFGPGFNGPLVVTAEIIGSTDPLGLLDDLKTEVEAMDGVEMVPLATPNPTADTGIIQVFPTTAPDDPATHELVAQLRDAQPRWEEEYGVATAVTGYTAVAIDVSDQLGRALLPFGVFVVGLSLVLLTMVFRSVVVPIKATVGYLLSVLAAFGATTLVFTDGIGASLINVETLGPVISFLPIITMGILFGLSMDYEVFLVSRMREDYAHGVPARKAVHTGFVGSSIVVVAAAIIMVAVFAFFVPESDRGSMQPIAFALTVGVALDAFVVRMTLVPAVMYLLGDKAWWLPQWLERRMPVLDVEGSALAEELALADWPARDDDHVVYTEALVAGDLDHRFHAPVTIALRPGERLVVSGDAGQRSALLMALSGRLPIVEGRARVTGQLLAEHASSIRRKVAVVDCERDHDVRRQLENLRAADPQRTRLVVLDNVDRLRDDATRDLVVDLVRTAPQAVVLGAQHHERLAQVVDAAVLRTRPYPTGRGDAAPDHTGHRTHGEPAEAGLDLVSTR